MPKQPPREQPEGEFPPKVWLLLWHCLKGGAYSKRRAWTGRLYFDAKQGKKKLTQYVSIDEHQAAMQSAVAEARAKAFREASEMCWSNARGEYIRRVFDRTPQEICTKLEAAAIQIRPSQGPKGSAE